MLAGCLVPFWRIGLIGFLKITVGSGWGSSFGISDLCLCIEERKDLLIYFFELSYPCLLDSRLNDVSELDRWLA
jgi:hypothetical protein